MRLPSSCLRKFQISPLLKGLLTNSQPYFSTTENLTVILPQTFYIKTWVSEFVFKSFPTILVTASEFIYVIVSLFHVCHLTIPLFPVDSSIYFKFWFDLLSMTMYCYQKSLDISSTPVYLLPTNSAIVRK